MSARFPGLRRVRAGCLLALTAAALAACQGTAPLRPAATPTRSIPPPGGAPVPAKPPVNVWAVPDAVPRVEPRSPYGNPPFYDVFGKRYTLLPKRTGYDERGVASWYGPGFYEEQTSTHEPYDMYAMTAAHKTLPLPCYVRVTNLQNGRSVVVRVNDRGPFVAHRIIDLSYTAAAKLGMLQKGTAMVEVRSIDPAAPAAPNPASPAAAALFIQTGAFADAANADRLLRKLRDNGYGDAFVRDDLVGGRRLYRVRIGPVKGVEDYDRITGALARIGVDDVHLALN